MKVAVASHPVFGRKGDDLTLDLPISYTEATLGANVEVPTLNGPVTLKVPAGTQAQLHPVGPGRGGSSDDADDGQARAGDVHECEERVG